MRGGRDRGVPAPLTLCDHTDGSLLRFHSLSLLPSCVTETTRELPFCIEHFNRGAVWGLPLAVENTRREHPCLRPFIRITPALSFAKIPGALQKGQEGPPKTRAVLPQGGPLPTPRSPPWVRPRASPGACGSVRPSSCLP